MVLDLAAHVLKTTKVTSGRGNELTGVETTARYSSSLLYGRVALVLCSRAAAGGGIISNGKSSIGEVVYRHDNVSGVVLVVMYGVILEQIMLLLLEAQTSDRKAAYGSVAWFFPVLIHLGGKLSAPSSDEKAVTAGKLTPT